MELSLPDSSDEAFDMKSLMNKFKNIANLTPKQVTSIITLQVIVS